MWRQSQNKSIPFKQNTLLSTNIKHNSPSQQNHSRFSDLLNTINTKPKYINFDTQNPQTSKPIGKSGGRTSISIRNMFKKDNDILYVEQCMGGEFVLLREGKSKQIITPQLFAKKHPTKNKIFLDHKQRIIKEGKTQSQPLPQ